MGLPVMYTPTPFAAPRRRAVLAWALVLLALLWPRPAAAQSGDEVVYYHTDAVGSVRMTTGPGGAVIERFDFQPFGAPIPGAAPTTPDVRQFAGKEQDTAAGLDYVGARYYAGGLGRFTSVDPVLDVEQALVDPQRWNRYAYALNNPLVLGDPDGREPVVTQRQLDFELPRWGYAALGFGALTGAAAIGATTAWRAAFGCLLSASCQSTAIATLEELAGGAPRFASTGDLDTGARGAFEIASEGGRHAGFLRNYAGRSAKELRSGIASLEQEVATHLDKIKNPEKYIDGFSALDPRQQKALLTKKWPDDIMRQREQIEILKRLLARSELQ